MDTVPSGAMMPVVTICPPDITICSMATGIPSRTARLSCSGTNRSFSLFRRPSMGERSRHAHMMHATTTSASAVPSAAPATPRSAPGSVKLPICREGKMNSRLNTTSSPHISTSRTLGVRMLPPACRSAAARLLSCRAGRDRAKMRKYTDAPCQMLASAPSQRGRLPETAMPASASTRPKITPMIRPCRTRLRASRSSPAPMRCAVWTQKPTVRARHRPLSSHVLEATSPMAALASRPRWPTMDESIYCMAMEDTCARMAGILNCRASSVCCRSVSSSPPRRDSRRSFFTAHTSFRYNRISYYTRCGGKGQERKSSARRQAGAAACFQWFFSDGPSSAGFSWRRQTCR